MLLARVNVNIHSSDIDIAGFIYGLSESLQPSKMYFNEFLIGDPIRAAAGERFPHDELFPAKSEL